jgi:hypothetical protein
VVVLQSFAAAALNAAPAVTVPDLIPDALRDRLAPSRFLRLRQSGDVPRCSERGFTSTLLTEEASFIKLPVVAAISGH